MVHDVEIRSLYATMIQNRSSRLELTFGTCSTYDRTQLRASRRLRAGNLVIGKSIIIGRLQINHVNAFEPFHRDFFDGNRKPAAWYLYQT